MARQFVKVRYRKGDTRTYSYHNDADPVSVGDTVKVPGRGSNDGWMKVEVVEIGDDAPSFPTKPILGKVEAEPGVD